MSRNWLLTFMVGIAVSGWLTSADAGDRRFRQSRASDHNHSGQSAPAYGPVQRTNGLPYGRAYYGGRYFGNFNNRFYGPQYGYF